MRHDTSSRRQFLHWSGVNIGINALARAGCDSTARSFALVPRCSMWKCGLLHTAQEGRPPSAVRLGITCLARKGGDAESCLSSLLQLPNATAGNHEGPPRTTKLLPLHFFVAFCETSLPFAVPPPDTAVPVASRSQPTATAWTTISTRHETTSRAWRNMSKEPQVSAPRERSDVAHCAAFGAQPLAVSSNGGLCGLGESHPFHSKLRGTIKIGEIIGE